METNVPSGSPYLQKQQLPLGVTYLDEGQGEETGLLWAWRWGSLASPPPPRPASPASEESEEGEGLQEEGGSLGEMMRCLVLLQRWGMFTPEETTQTQEHRARRLVYRRVMSQ